MSLFALALLVAGTRPVAVPLPTPGSAPPARFTTTLEAGGRTHVLALERTSFRSPAFRVRTWTRAAGLVELETPAPATYLGSVLGDPAASVVAALTPDGLRARLELGTGEVWRVEPEPASVGLEEATRRAPLHTVRTEDPGELDFGPCGTDTLEHATAAPPLPPQRPFDDLIPLDCLHQAEIAFDADFEYYQDNGSSVSATVTRIEEILALVNVYYARDVKIVHELTEIVVRTEPFYTPSSGGSLLNQFRTEWNTNMQDVPRDITHLMTGKPGSLIEFGGLAFVGVVCTGSQYGWSMDGANIVGHEVGHNWGAPHCLDPSPCNNMCGACLLILPNTKAVIEDHRDSRNCLDVVEPFPRALPPYAVPESRRLRKHDYEASGPIVFDVLANDHDGNCQPVRIAGFDPVSARGATVEFSPAGSAFERPCLIYNPTDDIFIGEDTFSYTIEDSTGLTATAVQLVEVVPTKLVHHWRFDDGAGDTALDATGVADGAADVPGAWTTGVHGGALEFDGTQRLVTGATSFPRPWSVATWVRRRPGATVGSSIIEASNGSLRIKQGPVGVEEVGLTHYSQGSSTFAYTAPLDEWVHLVFTGSAVGTEIWVDGQLVDVLPTKIRAPTGTIGRVQTPLFATLDDLRVYDYRLDAAQIGQLATTGGRAELPFPADGGKLVFPSLGLSWLEGSDVTSHDVYFGTSYAAVRDATPASPEFQGSQPGTQFPVGTLAAGTNYYWRVDEVGSQTVTGDVWQFCPAETQRWPLDETSGTSAANTDGGPAGTYVGGPLLGQPGATGALGNSIYLDGIDDRVTVPPLNLATDRMTITCWIRRDGTQLDWAGIVFSRSADTTAGLNFGTDEELRYHWDGGGWPWDSGLVVPDATWVFVALVVEPSQATIYLGDSGSLTSATNVAGHSAEPFEGTLFIGLDNGFGNRDFKGSIDDVRIFRAALTAAEIETLYATSQ